MDTGLVVARWLHTVAFVIAWGYYGVLARMVIPGLRDLEPGLAARTLDAIERRALPLILGSIVLFIVTGAYLLVSDDRYAGLGNVADSTWTSLMTLKHVVIVALVGLGVLIDYLVKSAEAPEADTTRRRIGQVRWAAEGATVLGALIVLLTVIAGAS